jgi:hypothetical protein
MFQPHVSQEYREMVGTRFLAVSIVATLTANICFWGIQISLAIYILCLPFYMNPGKFGRKEAQAARMSG